MVHHCHLRQCIRVRTDLIVEQDLNVEIPLVMRYGRQHCDADSPYQPAPNDAYPSPHGTYSATTGYFSNEFGLTANDTVALLGMLLYIYHYFPK